MKSGKDEALFINGVYKDVLTEILHIQNTVPDFILFLQPYKAQAMKKLEKSPPTCETPVIVYISTTDDLSTVSYSGEIVGWDDKRHISKEKHNALSRIIWTLQPSEGGLYNASNDEGQESVNLLHIRRLKAIANPFSVSQLIKTSDGLPYSENRTTAGGWSYVEANL